MKARFGDVGIAVVEIANEFSIDIDAKYVETGGGKSDCCRQADVPLSDDA